MTAPDIFDSPRVRSVNVIGTSTTRRPRRSARQVLSTWKQYPFDVEEVTSIRRSAEARNALKPAVVSWVPSVRTSRTYRLPAQESSRRRADHRATAPPVT